MLDFLSSRRPDWSPQELRVVVQKLSKVGVHEVCDLQERIRLGILNGQLEMVCERRLTAKTLQLLGPPATPAPAPTIVASAASAAGPGLEQLAQRQGRGVALEGGGQRWASEAVSEVQAQAQVEAQAWALDDQQKDEEEIIMEIVRQEKEKDGVVRREEHEEQEEKEKENENEIARQPSGGELQLPGKAAQVFSESDDCAICFEPVKCLTKLPCACKVHYCIRCWDRAMAESFRKSGLARCPTCRCAVRVDFDASKSLLTFAREAENPQQVDRNSGGTMQEGYFERTLERLARQVRPAQVQLLRSYGATLRRAAASSPEHEAASDEPLEGSSGAIDNCSIGPSCVCGAALIRMDIRQRTACEAAQAAQAILGDMEVMRARRTESSVIMCDLCNKEAPSQSKVWTCESGNRTIMHAAAHDICDRCFQRHTKGVDVDCTICGEPIDLLAELPCECKVTYCVQCWDKVMAQSFRTFGKARCPTCESLVRVDFDSTKESLVFSRETEDLQSKPVGDSKVVAADYFDRTVMRLASQMRPLQIRLLRTYSAAHPPGQGWSMSSSLVESRVKWGSHPAPRCVCGSALWRMSLSARAARAPTSAAHSTVGQAGNAEARSPALEEGIVCDLCDQEVPEYATVWTCENGDRTVRHATEYDICEYCFDRHVG